MIFAKCIRDEQIATSKEDFINRQEEFKEGDHHSYYPGETTRSSNGQDNLYCVPLNIIYDCLKYGPNIAIVEGNYDTTGSYCSGTPVKQQIASSWQKTIKIMKADCKETIDYIFNEVKDPFLISAGYLPKLSKNNQEYFKSKKYNVK